MTPEAPLWKQQCNAARQIQEEFGIEKAMGYLLGEKLMLFLSVVDQDAALRPQLAEFVAEARTIFPSQDLQRYFSGPRRIGALGHVLDEAGYETFRAAGAMHDDVVTAAEDALRFERMRHLMLG